MFFCQTSLDAGRLTATTWPPIPSTEFIFPHPHSVHFQYVFRQHSVLDVTLRKCSLLTQKGKVGPSLSFPLFHYTHIHTDTVAHRLLYPYELTWAVCMYHLVAQSTLTCNLFTTAK